MENKKNISLERADYPEQVGVSSREIAELIKDFKESNIEVHSIMVLRHGKVAFETWADPYAPDMPHAAYSVSKSFTSAAVGFAVSEGLLSLDTRVIDIFPEYCEGEPDENLQILNVHHLLSMQSGKSVSVFTDKGKNQWIKDFFDAPWKFKPGEGWEYISENQYMLCAMLTRVTGMSVIDYLTPRLFEPLGIDVPFWEKDADGIEAGGWGLFLKTEDIAKFTLCYQQKGVFNGQQVIPADWVHKSQKIQADNSAVNKTPDSQSGYGYCFWRCAGVHGYRADGMFSQFGIVAKDYDAAFIMTAGEVNEQKTRDCIWRHFPKCLIEADAEETLEERPALAPLDDDLPAMQRSLLEEWLHGKKMKFSKNMVLSAAGFPVSMLPIPIVYMSADKAGGITDIVFEFDEDTCTMSWAEGDEKNTIVCGMDGKPRRSPITLAKMPFTANSTAAWTTQNELTIHMRPIEAVCQRIIKFTFDDDEVSFSPSSKPPITAIADYLKHDMDHFLPQIAPIQTLGVKAFEQAHHVLDVTHKGKFVDEDAEKEKEKKKDKDKEKDRDKEKEKEKKREKRRERRNKNANIKRVAQFSKVSFENFCESWADDFGGTPEEIREIYDGINLPRRATSGSAGYDVFSPVDFTLEPGQTIKIPTGIRCEIEEGWVLKIYPRSGLGFKFRLQLNNTVGIIDSDYFYSDNEGHIFIKITNDSNEGKTVEVKAGQGFAQGIFIEYGITFDDDVTDIRNGGFGSTTK